MSCTDSRLNRVWTTSWWIMQICGNWQFSPYRSVHLYRSDPNRQVLLSWLYRLLIILVPGRICGGYKVYQETILYLALKDDESRLQYRIFCMFGVEEINTCHLYPDTRQLSGWIVGKSSSGSTAIPSRYHEDTIKSEKRWIMAVVILPTMRWSAS